MSGLGAHAVTAPGSHQPAAAAGPEEHQLPETEPAGRAG